MSEKLPSILSLKEEIKKNKFKSVYFFCGEDFQAINNALKEIETSIAPFIASDFDKEIINPEKNQSIGSILDIASAYPFGSEKKLVVVKNYELLSDKKLLSGYLKSPPEFTVLVIANYGKITSFKKEPLDLLLKNNFVYEARKLRGRELIFWLMESAKELGYKLTGENAQLIVDIAGDDTSLLKMHLQKFINFPGIDSEITTEAIENLSSHTKEYNIFNLQDAISQAKKGEALKIAFNLLDSGFEITRLISMLTKYFITITLSLEHSRNKTSDKEAAVLAGVSFYYYINCKKAKYFLSDKRLLNAVRSLLAADVKVKTTSIDEKTITAAMISEFFAE